MWLAAAKLQPSALECTATGNKDMYAECVTMRLGPTCIYSGADNQEWANQWGQLQDRSKHRMQLIESSPWEWPVSTVRPASTPPTCAPIPTPQVGAACGRQVPVPQRRGAVVRSVMLLYSLPESFLTIIGGKKSSDSLFFWIRSFCCVCVCACVCVCVVKCAVSEFVSVSI